MKTIVVVDDEPWVLDVFQGMLRDQKDWHLIFAVDGREAWEMIQSILPDVIVSDITMPQMDGFELLRKIRASEAFKNIPVVMVTGLADSDIKGKALNLGATDLLNKPVSKEELVARISNLLKLKEYQDQIKQQNVLLEDRVRERTRDLEQSRLDIIWRLAKAGEYRDEDTGSHVVRVSWYCRTLAETMGCDSEFTRTIFFTSPLHDLGKIGVPDVVLLKPGRLDGSEWDIMKQHCLIGASILNGTPDAAFSESRYPFFETGIDLSVQHNPFLSAAAVIALNHHEKWNGKGYPQGLSGEDIPLESLIVAMADVYDALRSTRPYKSAFTEQETLEIIEQDGEEHFSPDVYSAFLKSVKSFNDIREDFSDIDYSRVGRYPDFQDQLL